MSLGGKSTPVKPPALKVQKQAQSESFQQVVNNSNSNNNNTSNVYNIIQIHIDRKEADDTIKGLVDTVHKKNPQTQNNNGQPEA